LPARCADDAFARAYDRRRFLREDRGITGPRSPVDRVLEHAGNAVVVLGRDVEDPVRGGYRRLQPRNGLGLRVAVHVGVVERQIAITCGTILALGGQSSTAARSALLKEPLRRLPANPRITTSRLESFVIRCSPFIAWAIPRLRPRAEAV